MTYRAVRGVLISALTLLTIVALLPLDMLGPFDARDYSVLDGWSLDYPWWAALLEPLFAPAHVLMGAPDFRIATAISYLWLIAAAFGFALLSGLRARLTVPALAGKGLLAMVASTGGFVLYLTSAALLPFPGWRLVVDDPNLIVADLQTHTYGSHDGIVAAKANLEWHRERGYDLVAVTEHKRPEGGFAARALAKLEDGPLPVVIPGVEVSTEHDEYLLGLGVVPSHDVLPWKGNEKDYAREFIRDIHEGHGGAVAAMAWHLDIDHVIPLVESGVDAFEIANTGHPDVSLALRERLLEVAAAHGVVLLASTDWHGWGGFTRTWNVIAVPGAANMPAEHKASEVVRLLRTHRGEAFTPVVAGYIGPPSMLRAVFSPLVETFRYATELSPGRLVALWLWAGLLLYAAKCLAPMELRPARTMGALVIGGLGCALIAKGVALMSVVPGGSVLTEDTGLWGGRALTVGVAGLAASLAALRLEARQRRRARE